MKYILRLLHILIYIYIKLSVILIKINFRNIKQLLKFADMCLLNTYLFIQLKDFPKLNTKSLKFHRRNTYFMMIYP